MTLGQKIEQIQDRIKRKELSASVGNDLIYGWVQLNLANGELDDDWDEIDVNGGDLVDLVTSILDSHGL